MLPYSNGSPQFMVLKKQLVPLVGAVAFLMLSFLTGIYVPFVKFPIRITSDNTGSSQNVPILAKGEPLTVLAAPTFIIMYRGLFSYEFLRNKYTKFSMLKLAIFTDWDFVHFYQVPYYRYFQAVHSKKVPPEFSGGTFLC